MAAFVGDINKAKIATSRAYDWLDLPAEEGRTATPQPLPSVRGRVTFENVTFWYSGEEAPRRTTLIIELMSRKGHYARLHAAQFAV